MREWHSRVVFSVPDRVGAPIDCSDAFASGLETIDSDAGDRGCDCALAGATTGGGTTGNGRTCGLLCRADSGTR